MLCREYYSHQLKTPQNQILNTKEIYLLRGTEGRDKGQRQEREKVTKKRGERGQGIEVSSIYPGGYGAGLPLAREERDRCAP